jgi:hypothetical protein
MNELTRRQNLSVWGLCCVLAGLTFLFYASASLTAGRGQFIMPLDDVYIHFQYARQLAEGQPYIYNPGQPPTSGATSFLYPYVLALGYRLGFQGLALGAWAMGVGALAFALSLWLVYRIALQWRVPSGTAVFTLLLFGLTGAVQWHFMSGMETGLVILALFLSLYWFNSHSQLTLIGLFFLSLLRPEGGGLAGITALLLAWRGRGWSRRLMPLVLVAGALAVQPLLNLLLTGSAVASGNSAKSVFGMIPFDVALVPQRILEQFMRIWVELGTGISPREGLYLLPLCALIALAGWGKLLRQRETRYVAVTIAGWVLAGTAAIATLDTAFWHFKRYQMPFLALLFPLIAVGITVVMNWVGSRLTALKSPPVLATAAGLLLVASVTLTVWPFLQHFALNAGYVYAQPYQMVQWLIQNTPPDARVAVHDTGLLRYLGGRTTLDMVGLTTPGAADYWRNGPGSVAEFLLREQPDYIAAYGPGHGFGLSYLAETRLYGQSLASFPVWLDDHFNVALAADVQGIYQPDWTTLQAERAANAIQPYGDQDWGALLASVNVADLASERDAHYTWQNRERLPGFPTEVFDLDYLACALPSCQVIDGGRRITGEESFTLKVPAALLGERNILVTRLLPLGAGRFQVYANSSLIAARIIPDVPGRWIEVPTLLPSALSGDVQIRIVPEVSGGIYAPYRHWLYRQLISTRRNQDAYADFPAAGFSVAINRIDYDEATRQFTLELAWLNDGTATGDYRLFVHVYADVDQPPVVQADQYPGGGALPPGNWLPGAIHDTIRLDLSDLLAGRYALAFGLYNPYTGERLLSPGADSVGRVFFQDVVIP